MPSYSELAYWLCLRCGLLNAAVFALCEAERVVAGLDDLTVMRYSVEQCGCHLGIAKNRHPLSELQIGCDDDAGLLIKLTDEVEQQRPAGFRERDVSQFINDHTIHLGQLANNFGAYKAMLISLDLVARPA